MKKSLLAVAVVAALPAMAHAQTNVTMFGILDASVNMTDANGTGAQAGKATRLLSGVQSTNRWGVRGSEALGGGMSAVFHLEGGLNVDDGTGKTAGAFDFQRRAVVGLSGGFGTVLFGRDYTPGFIPSGAGDFGGYGMWGTNLGNWTNGANGGNGVRWSNAIHYQGSFGPIGVRAAHSFGAERDVAPKTSGTATGIAVSYAGGPFGAHAFYHTMNDTVAAAATQTKTKQMGFGGSAAFGPAKIFLGYVATDPDGAVKLTGVNLGATFALGGGSLGIQGHNLKETSVSAKGTSIGLFYDKPLSKRTNIYVSAGVMRNNTVGTFGLRASDQQLAPAAAGADPKAVAFGVRHQF